MAGSLCIIACKMALSSVCSYTFANIATCNFITSDGCSKNGTLTVDEALQFADHISLEP